MSDTVMLQPPQPLMGHLLELRRRLIWVVGVYCLATALAYAFAQPLYGFLTQPLAAAGSQRLIYTGLTEAFMTYLKIALFAGAVITVPVLLWHVWAFVTPGLYRHERLAIAPFFIFAPVLFGLGAALAYGFVIPLAWEFFLSFQHTNPESGLPIVLEARVAEYLSLTTTLMMAFGLAFQLPVILGVLGRLGIVKAAQLVRFRKWAVVLILIVAAILTPPDILSQTSLAVPLYALYEISILLVRYYQRKAA